MTVKDLESLPDGIVPQVSKLAKQQAEELYAQMYKVILDRQDAIDAAKITVNLLGRETKHKMWDLIAQELDRLGK